MRTTAPERPAVPGPSSSPGRRPAWREQRGQTASDYLGILLIVSFIVAALFASGVGTTIADRVEVLICQIGGGTNCEQADGNAALEPCLISSSEGKSNFKVFVGVVEIGKESVLIREDFSDGRSRFTLVDSSELKGELFAGAKAKIGKFGISAAAEAAAGGRLKGAQVFEVPTDKADEFEESVAAAGSFEGILRDAAELNDTLPFGIPNPLGGFDDFALDVLGIDKDDPITDPTEEYIDVSAIIGANGTAGVGGGVADAEVSGMVEGAAGAKVIHEGKRAGEVELYYQLKGELGGSLSAGLYGVNLGGESTFVATMTLDKHGNPKTLKITGAAGYTGALELGDGIEGKDAAQLHEALEKLSLSATAGEGKAIEVGGELDLSDPANRAVAMQLLTPNPTSQAAAVAPLIERMYSDGKLSVDFFDVSKDEAKGEVKVGIGIGGGAGGGQKSEDKTATGSYVREPGGTFQERKCKR